jgi:hypothetical protein
MPPHILPITIFHPATPIVLGLFSRGQSEYCGTYRYSVPPKTFGRLQHGHWCASFRETITNQVGHLCPSLLATIDASAWLDCIAGYSVARKPASTMLSKPGQLALLATEIPQFYEIDLGQVKDCFVHGPESGPSVPRAPSLEPALYFEIQFHMRRYNGDRSESLF